jgi:hypothetical protein
MISPDLYLHKIQHSTTHSRPCPFRRDSNPQSPASERPQTRRTVSALFMDYIKFRNVQQTIKYCTSNDYSILIFKFVVSDSVLIMLNVCLTLTELRVLFTSDGDVLLYRACNVRLTFRCILSFQMHLDPSFLDRKGMSGKDM